MANFMQYKAHWKDAYLCSLLAATALIQQGKTHMSSSGKLAGRDRMLCMLRIQIKPSQPLPRLTYSYVKKTKLVITYCK